MMVDGPIKIKGSSSGKGVGGAGISVPRTFFFQPKTTNIHNDYINRLPSHARAWWVYCGLKRIRPLSAESGHQSASSSE